jgi:hypothetical protein
MDYGSGYGNPSSGISWRSVLAGVGLSLVVIFISSIFIKYSNTRPLQSGFADFVPKTTEGFNAVNGVGNIPCGQDLADGEALYSMFLGRDLNTTEDGKKDLEDLRVLLAKLACMKRDLLSPSGTISAEKELKFCTYSDIQPSAETTSRCLSKQIPERDLEIQIEKWNIYGKDLIKRLCTDTSMSEQEVVSAEKKFDSVMSDVYSIARVKCLTGVPIDNDCGPRDPVKYMSPELKNLREYDGYKSTFF